MISFDWTSETTSKHFTGEKGKTTWELRLDMCWLKPFFLPTHHPSWLTSLKKSSDVSISHNVKLSFFILQQCHEWCGKKVQNMCFLHSSQCSLCFLFLCFLSFFLLEHLTQNHCWSSGGAVRIPTQGQWYQSSQSSHPIIGLPSSALLHPGHIQIWFPHSSRILSKYTWQKA